MYYTQNIASKIEEVLKRRQKNKTNMLRELSMGINTISELSKGRELSCIRLAEIADYLDCSVDYLLGRTEKINPDWELDALDTKLYAETKDLSPQQKQELIEYVQFRKGQQQKDRPEKQRNPFEGLRSAQIAAFGHEEMEIRDEGKRRQEQ